MADSRSRQLSLDTNLLLDLAKPQDLAHEFREEFQSRGYALMLAPTVLSELEYLLTYGRESSRHLAQTASEEIEAWRLTPFDLSQVNHAIAERFSRDLQQRNLVPADELNDALILAETSLAEVPILVTSDKHLLEIDEDALRLAFQEADLLMVHSVHPKRLLRALR